jgi:hypothetical protein
MMYHFHPCLLLMLHNSRIPLTCIHPSLTLRSPLPLAFTLTPLPNNLLRSLRSLTHRRLVEVKGMADRIIAMRSKLYDTLVRLDTPGEWGHIKSQIGMFSYTGLKPEQVDALAEKAHVYLTRDGRISMAGLNDSNVEVSRG